MKYDTAIILFCHGVNDYAVWEVDLPADFIQQARNTEPVTDGDLRSVMGQVPMIGEEMDAALHLLFYENGQFSLHRQLVDESFLDAYQHTGCSARGSMEVILSEVADCFPELDTASLGQQMR